MGRPGGAIPKMVEPDERERLERAVLLNPDRGFSRDNRENHSDARHGVAARRGEVTEPGFGALIGVGGEEQLKVLSAGDRQIEALLLRERQQGETGGEWNGGVIQHRRDLTLLTEMAKILNQAIAQIDHGVGESMASQRTAKSDPGERPEVGGDRPIDEPLLA